MKVYAIARVNQVSYGQQDYGEELKIEQIDAYHKVGKWNPVFKTYSSAETFLNNLDIHTRLNSKIVELEVKE